MSNRTGDAPPYAAPADRELPAELAAATQQRLAQAAPLLRAAGRVTPRIKLRFDLTGRSAGQVIWRTGSSPCIRYNLALAEVQPESFLHETVAHEVAHVVAYWCHGQVPPHGREWQVVMRHFGFARPQRCHNFALGDTPVRQQRRWRYVCACRDHDLSTTRHNRVQTARLYYVCRYCGTTLHYLPG